MDDHAADHGADQPLDATDAALLSEVARLYREIDPVPPRLLERISFGLALDEVYAEVAEMSQVPLDLAGVRGGVGEVRTATITFAAESLTAMVTVTHLAPDQIRIDGWVAPSQRISVRLRMQAGRLDAVTDAVGRFSFVDLPDGFVQLSFHRDNGQEGGGSAVVTPSFEL